MTKTLIFLVFVISALEFSESLKTQNTLISIESSPTTSKQRRSEFYQKWKIIKSYDQYPQLKKYHELYQKLLDEIEEEKLKRKNEEDLKRSRIFEKHLLPFHNGSSFLRDFHTRRF